MVASQARILANRANSLKSTGPSPEGRLISRRNGLKHGLTGQGVVLADRDADEVEARDAALQKELAPQSQMGQILVRQMATLSVRMERAAKQESAAIERNVRHAAEDFDQSRLDQAERLLGALGEEPRANLRKLRRSPEGVDRLIVEWQELRADLTGEPRPSWTARHRDRAENLTGHRLDEARISRIGALSKAAWGDFSDLAEGSELADEDRRAWARLLLVERIDEAIAELEEHYETLDFETIEQDRAEAPVRALFDPSREASLARRYESEARRGFFKAYKELKQAEAEHAARPTPKPPALPRPPLACSEKRVPHDCNHAIWHPAIFIGAGAPKGHDDSSWEERAPNPRDPRPTPCPPSPTSDRPVDGPFGRLETPGRPPLGSS
jgi:hypothetical protein